MLVLPHCACRCTALTNKHNQIFINHSAFVPFSASRFSFSFKQYFLCLPHFPCFDFRSLSSTLSFSLSLSRARSQANFLDVGGGASEKQVMDAFTLLDGDRSVKAILGMRARVCVCVSVCLYVCVRSARYFCAQIFIYICLFSEHRISIGNLELLVRIA